MLIASMYPGEELGVASFIWKVFEAFEAPCYSQEGIDEFKTYIAPEALAARCQSGDYFVLCCLSRAEILGVIAIRDYKHISLLFVKKEMHRQGIARKLLKKAIENCRVADATIQTITVNSSRYAVEAYERLGFVKTGSEQEKNGIRFTPMQLDLKV